MKKHKQKKMYISIRLDEQIDTDSDVDSKYYYPPKAVRVIDRMIFLFHQEQKAIWNFIKYYEEK